MKKRIAIFIWLRWILPLGKWWSNRAECPSNFTRLIDEINSLCDEFDTSLDWEYPPDPSPWTKEEWYDFFKRSKLIYEKLEKELGADYELISELEKDKHMYMDNRIFADK